MHYFPCDYTLPHCKATWNTCLLNRNTNTTNDGNCLTEGFMCQDAILDTYLYDYLISQMAWWAGCYCYCHWGFGNVTDLAKVTQRVCGRAGLQTWALVAPDPTFLITGLFLFLPEQFRDVGQRMKGLVVSRELFFEWDEYLFSESLPFG